METARRIRSGLLGRSEDSLHARLVLAVLLSSFALKATLAWLVRDMACVADECAYLRLARVLTEQGTYTPMIGALWPPGQAFFLAACDLLLPDAATAARLIQGIASTLTGLLVYETAKPVYGRRAALVAMTAVSFYPNLVFFSHTFWPETNYLVFFCAAVLVLTRRPSLSRGAAISAGCLFGLSAYFKAVALYFVPAAALWVLLCKRGKTGTVLLMLGAALLTISPWTVRNYVVYDRFLLLDASLGRNLTKGLSHIDPPSYDWPERRQIRVPGGRMVCVRPNLVDADRCDIRNGLAFVRDNPGRYLELVPFKWADLLTPSSFLIRHVRRQLYPHVFDTGGVQLITVLSAGGWIALCVLGLLGLIVRTGGQLRWLIWLLVAYHLAVTTLAFGTSRFRLPIVPYLAIAAGAAVAAGPRLLEIPAAGDGRARLALRWLLFIVAAGALTWLWSRRWDAVFDVFAGR